ncbi:dihydrolipoyl dehydrogenase [candidate division KSB1 bacterium]|nr:MAG: dihydrolipoyl dehydrogenase [candidate division KSB1 bacterium]MBC6948507.1 dihydrolipoyl dehydrogenase [candidate division KSB1 bacterium]MCE7940418.1 dihydrolipoyl dehydrogenase [Chlorobi bacterium CHB1]MDL1875584.1 dihydrolipoyl dehydrogenase [Cytophagia bacterium CHB2]
MKEFDLVIVGGGPGGYVAAIRAAQLGMKVAVIEKDKLGGLCLNWGCIPSKALLRSAEVYHLLQHVQDFGLSVSNISFEWQKIIQRSRKVSEQINKGVHFLFRKNKIEHIDGAGRLRKGNVVEVTKDGKAVGEYKGKNIIIATGGSHRTIPGVALDRKRVITSTEAMIMSEMPKSMIVIGGGPIGVEFAYFYNAFGCKVTIIEMMPQILPLEDEEVVKALTANFKKSGMTIATNAKVSGVNATAKDVTVSYTVDGAEKSVTGEVALMAIGFSGQTSNLGLEEAGITVEKSFINVDRRNYSTNVPGVYAIGDVIGAPLLAHVASAEGITCIEHIAGKAPHPVNYNNIPGCTYCQPQVGSVGLTEKQAREKGYDVAVGRFPFRPLGKAVAVGETEGFVKLVVDKKYGEILGAHILGSEATDLIAELVAARALESTVHHLAKIVHAHPTFTEAVMEAAADALGEAIHI